jgi:glycosyltransferase involved in cell wall biosynthesis
MTHSAACSAPAATRSCAVALAIPTLNEEDSIAGIVRSVPRDVVSRIIVADGGSTDATAARAREAGADVIEVGRGYGRACLAAAAAAEDAGILVFMDGDGADDPAFVTALTAPIETGSFDFVIGSRARGVREPGSMSWHQLAAGRLAGIAIRALYGVNYTDMCAFRAIRRDALLRLGMTEMTYGWNIEMQMRAAAAGLRILEIPVPYRRRRGGVSKVAGSLRGTLRAAPRIIVAFIRVARTAPSFPSPVRRSEETSTLCV